MNTDYFDDLDDQDVERMVKPQRRVKVFPKTNQPKPNDEIYLSQQDNARSNFKFTYHAARFEEWWLLDSLSDFYEYQWISDVLKRVKGGKEASVYLCTPGAEVDSALVAAKVYRPRSLRNLKNDGQYRVGRVDLDEDGKRLTKEADVKAVMKRTSYGEDIRHRSWIAYELNTLQDLHAAGADVPKAYTLAKNAILMEFIGDEAGAAPALNEVRLGRDEAQNLFERTMRNIEIMLTRGCIHGDLSAYNILYWEGNITLIDFPQIVSPTLNPKAFTFFTRDVTRVCAYFEKQGIKINAPQIAEELWLKHGYKIKTVDPRLLAGESE